MPAPICRMTVGGLLHRVGDDPLAHEMLSFIHNAGIATESIVRIKGGTPGLCLINLKDGERTFNYWRSTSAARQLATDANHLRKTIEAADVIYFLGITLGTLANPMAFMRLTGSALRGTYGPPCLQVFF